MSTVVTIKQPARYVKFTYPLPTGKYSWSAVNLPLTVYDGGRELPCQVERQSRYEDGSCASVFVYADAGAGNAPTQVTVKIEASSEREYKPFVWHPALHEIRSQLVFARDDEGRLLPPTMNGPVCVQRKLDGEEAWVTFFSDCPAVYVVGMRHNAHPGAGDVQDFMYLPLQPPYGWAAQHMVPEPLADPSTGMLQGPDNIGWLPQRVGRPYRYVLHPLHEIHRVPDAMPTFGLGVASPAWRSERALAPHFIPCADLGWVNNLSTQQTSAWGVLRAAITNGTQYPPPPYNYAKSRRIGWLHPMYATEGGETSGTGIDFGHGQLQGFFQTGNPDVVLRAMGEQFGRMSRDRWLIIESSGEPATWERYAPGNLPIGGWRLAADDPAQFDSAAGKVLDGPFGYSTAIPAVADQDLIDLKGFECTDWGHITRAALWDTLLAQAINCPLSRWLIRARGELARMAWKSGNRQHNDVANAMQGLGLPRDRILGWQWWCMALAYAWGPNKLRSRFQDDIDTAEVMLLDATRHVSTACALKTGKQVTRTPYNGQYAVCVQPTGECQLWIGAMASSAVVGTGSTLTHHVAQGALTAMKWLNAGGNMVWSAAVYRLSDQQRIMVRDDALSSVAWASGQYDDAQALGVLGLVGFVIDTGDNTALMALIHNLLGPTPLAKLRQRGMGAVDSDLVLVAYLQSVGSP